MNPSSEIRFQVGLPETLRHQASSLYYAAFRQKLHPIFRDEERGIAVLEQAIQLSYAVVALADDHLLGIAGFKDYNGSLINLQPQHMTKAFGWWGGTWRLLALSLFDRPKQAHVLIMDGIVVDSQWRGSGIGSRLLDHVLALAHSRGYEQVRLDVVDTNPRARQLYERKGFLPVETHAYPYLRRLFSFSAATTMIKSVG